MPAKLVALYKQPEDPEAFEKRYFEGHSPLVDQIPGLQKNVITRFGKALAGEGFYMMAEMYFADRDALKAALRSPEMAATGEDIQKFAGHLMTLMMAEEE
jgi:uncharacterized protein (TIGR02118 family)